MSVDSNILKLLDKVAEVSERTARMEVEQRHIQEDVAEIRRQDAIQNDLLDTHIQGTITNRKRLEIEIKAREDLQSRVEALEEAPIFIATFKKYLKWVASVAAAVLIILKLVKFL